MNAGMPGTGISYRERVDATAGFDRSDALPRRMGERPKRQWGWLLVLLLGIAIGAAFF